MKIPQSFKKAIAKIFYDKEIAFYRVVRGVDSEGGRTSNATELVATVLCNAQFKTNENDQKEYGLELNSDIIITTDVEIEKELLFKYLGNTYRVNEVKQRDSHFLIGGVEYVERNAVWV